MSDAHGLRALVEHVEVTSQRTRPHVLKYPGEDVCICTPDHRTHERGAAACRVLRFSDCSEFSDVRKRHRSRIEHEVIAVTVLPELRSLIRHAGVMKNHVCAAVVIALIHYPKLVGVGLEFQVAWCKY